MNNIERIRDLQGELKQIHQRGKEIQGELRTLWETELIIKTPEPTEEIKTDGKRT